MQEQDKQPRLSLCANLVFFLANPKKLTESVIALGAREMNA
jgi:hypothetical protein